MSVMRRPGPDASVADWKGYAQFLHDEAVRQAKIGNGAIYEADALRTQLAGAVSAERERIVDWLRLRANEAVLDSESRDALLSAAEDIAAAGGQ